MLEAFDRSYISKHRLSSQILSSVYKASLTSLGCAAMSALVSRSSYHYSAFCSRWHVYSHRCDHVWFEPCKMGLVQHDLCHVWRKT
eukprot:1198840-Pyramimonas_sp.AAC.2